MPNVRASSPRKGLLSLLVDSDLAASIREDLNYQRSRDREKAGRAAAFIRHALRMAVTMGPLIAYAVSGGLFMIAATFRMARRSLAKHKAFSLINILGLSIGMAVGLFLVLWVQDELSFDTFHANASKIYRVDVDWNGRVSAMTPYPLGPALETAVPEVEAAPRVASLGTVVLRNGDKAFYQSDVRAVDPSFLRVFSFPLKEGNPATALDGTHSMILTESAAKKYFGSEDPIGRTVTMDGRFDFMVTGIMRDVPPNSSLRHEALVPLEFMREFGWYIDRWGSENVTTWVKVKDGAQADGVRTKLAGLYRSHFDPPSPNPSLVGLTTINLYASAQPGQAAQKIQTVRLFGGLAAAILLIACINFMNLSTARSAKRAMEVGLRKTVGARRGDLLGQFYGESLIVTGISFLLAIGLVFLFLPSFNALAGKSLAWRSFLRTDKLLAFAGIALLTGILSGSYPALFLSSFRPVKVLKGTLRMGTRSGVVRKVLIITQFALAVIVLVGTFVVLNQLRFLRSKSVGYDKEQLIYLSLQGETRSRFSAFRDQLARESDVVAVSGLFQRPTSFGSRITGADWEGRKPDQNPTVFYSAVDPRYVETMKIDIIEGRAFSFEFPGDFADEALINGSMARSTPEGSVANPANGFLINQELARIMGGKNLVGKRLSMLGAQGLVVGVMKDFHFQALQQKIEPLALFASPAHVRFVVVRLPRGRISEGLASVRKTWERVFPGFPFEFRFYDEDFGRMFQSETRLAALLRWAAGLAIFIACLGLLGLASFLAEQRTREIGIRKTLGASSSRITVMLTKEFFRFVVWGNVIAAPVAYLIAGRWLRGYAYRISLNGSAFALALALTLAAAVLTVGRQVLKTARVNPARCLKDE